MGRDQKTRMGNREGPPQEEVIASIAARVARRYRQRASWTSEEDLYQEALVTAYEARTNWDPAVGVPFPQYAWQACLNHLRMFVWQTSSPVSINSHGMQHYAEYIRGISYGLELNEHILDEAPPADELVIEKDWQARLRDQVAFLLFGGKSELEGKAAARVVLDEDPPRVVAQELDLPVTQVYRIARRARRLLEENAVLFDLWRERNDDEDDDQDPQHSGAPARQARGGPVEP